LLLSSRNVPQRFVLPFNHTPSRFATPEITGIHVETPQKHEGLGREAVRLIAHRLLSARLLPLGSPFA
jgi:hypothetical protein